MRNILHIICSIITAFLLIIIHTACDKHINRNVETYELPDTLIVGTLYSPTTFFIFKGDTLGYEYERINKFTQDKGIVARFVLGNNLPHMIELLDSGKIDLIAYEVPITNEYKNIVIHCGNENITNQVLVQSKSNRMITDAIQLIGQEVYVEKGSKYESRLKNLDNEVGGGIIIHSVSPDSATTEDLIEMVADRKVPLTITDSDIAKINRTYFKNINIEVPISFAQRASWAVKDSILADSINSWNELQESKNASMALIKRYFELSKNEERNINYPKLNFSNGNISPYDHIFKKYAPEIGWDWRILAAQAWSESRFDTTAVSWAGAKGLMQLMPGTARAYGLDIEHITNPELNVKAAVANIKELNRILSKRVPNEEERMKFILAAYNSGVGHVLDAIALAKKYGKNPQIWEGNVSETLRWKANPEYFNDEVCRAGYFRGSETIAYVEKVNKYYNYFKSKI